MMVGNNLKDQQLQQIVDKTIMEADKDGDGKLDFEEFKEMIGNTDIARQLTLEATQAELGTVPDMSAADTRKAIDAAAAALPAWREQSAKSRQDLLTKLFISLQDNAEDLAKIIVAENGKSLTEAKGEIAYSNGFIEWFAAEATRTYGHTVPAPLPGVRNVVVKQPIGVCGLITP
ncbi:hypothetical protein L7F22_060945 [Adiantum nelumboides]|nr:hypothetical protein [Adiantum nelumboides]